MTTRYNAVNLVTFCVTADIVAQFATSDFSQMLHFPRFSPLTAS